MAEFLGRDDGASSLELRAAALNGHLRHLVGESRSWLLQVDYFLNEIEGLRDERTARVIEALGLTRAETAPPGTLRHLERAASELLRTLTEIAEAVRPAGT